MLAIWVEGVTALLALGGIIYMILALWGARDFDRTWRRRGAQMGFAPDVSILKPVKGVDQRMHAGLVSHCNQKYAGRFEIVFGVSSLDDPAVAEIERLRAEFPDCAIRLVECHLRLGTSGKVSNLVQMLPEAQYEHVLINDSDILVSPHYLTRIMNCFDAAADASASKVGLVTAPYIGRTPTERPGIWSRLEALGISTDFFAGVLAARKLEGGIRFGLGSTLATTKAALAKAGDWSRWWSISRTITRWELGLPRPATAWSLRMRWWRLRFRRIASAGLPIISCAGRGRRATRAGLDTWAWG